MNNTIDEIKKEFFLNKGRHSLDDLKGILGSLILLDIFKDEWKPMPITGPCDCGMKMRVFENIAKALMEDRCECGYTKRWEMESKYLSFIIEHYGFVEK
jgi:hypothetical protein